MRRENPPEAIGAGPLDPITRADVTFVLFTVLLMCGVFGLLVVASLGLVLVATTRPRLTV